MRIKLKIAISACLLGRPVRYDGTGRWQPQIVGFFADKAELIPVCPETELGLGVPRETIHLVDDVFYPRLETTGTKIDLTADMQDWIVLKLAALGLEDIKGCILKARSPSCGLKGTKVRLRNGEIVPGRGIFAQAMTQNLPHLVYADEEDLQTLAGLEDFWERVLLVD